MVDKEKISFIASKRKSLALRLVTSIIAVIVAVILALIISAIAIS